MSKLTPFDLNNHRRAFFNEHNFIESQQFNDVKFELEPVHENFYKLFSEIEEPIISAICIQKIIEIIKKQIIKHHC